MVAPVSTLGVRLSTQCALWPLEAIRSFGLREATRCAREPSGPRERHGERVDLETVDRALSFCVSSHCPMRVSSHLLSKSMCESTCRASLGSVRASSHLALLPGPVRFPLSRSHVLVPTYAFPLSPPSWPGPTYTHSCPVPLTPSVGPAGRTPRRRAGSRPSRAPTSAPWQRRAPPSASVHAEERSTIGCASESADACAAHRRQARLRNAQGSHPRKGARCAPGAALTAVMLLVVCVCQLSCCLQRVRQLPCRMQCVRWAAP